MLIYFCILIDDDLLRFIILQIVLPIFLIFQACSEVTGNITNSEAFNFECPESYFVIQNRFKEKISWSHIITHCKEGKSTCINGRLATQQQLLEGLICYKRKQHKNSCQLSIALEFHCSLFLILDLYYNWKWELSGLRIFLPTETFFWHLCSFYLNSTLMLLLLQSSQTAFNQLFFHWASHTTL